MKGLASIRSSNMMLMILFNMNRKIVLVLIICFTVLGLVMTLKFNQATRFDRLNITQDEWNEIVANRSEDAISLSNLKFNDYDLVIDNNNSKLYYSVVQSSPSKFTPLVSFKASESQAKLAILEDEITEDKIQNNHAFQVLLYNDDTYHIYRLYCTSFPMLNIVYSEQEKTDQFNIPMSMYLFNNQDNGINRIARSEGTINQVEMEDGSYNYTFSLKMTTTGNNERDNVISLLNMKPSNEYFLNAINIGENDSPMKENRKIPEEFPKLEDVSGDKTSGIKKKKNDFSGEKVADRQEKFKDFPRENSIEFSGEKLAGFSGERAIEFSGEKPTDFSGEPPRDLQERPMNGQERNNQRVELFINNEYIGLYSLSYDPDMKIRPRNR